MPSFVEIGEVVPKKKIFEGFLPYMGMAAILVKRDVFLLFPEKAIISNVFAFV